MTKRAPIRAALILSLLGYAFCATPLSASTYLFNAANYNNNNPNTAGVFLDFLDGTHSNQTTVGTNSVLQFTNAGATGGETSDTLLDPGLGSPATTFQGSGSQFMDFTIGSNGNANGAGTGAGIVFLFNSGAGQTGLSVMVLDTGKAGNHTDILQLYTVSQTGINTAIGTAITLPALDNLGTMWYQLELTETVSGGNFTVNAQLFPHSTATDPTSGLGSQIGTTLTFTGVLSTYSLQATGSTGVLSYVTSTGVTADTNVYDFDETAAPEPGTLMSLGGGLLALVAFGRRFRK